MPDPILDALNAACDDLRAATTPVDVAMAKIRIAHCNWALVHDITERLFGDPDWFKDPFAQPGASPCVTPVTPSANGV